MSNLYSIDVKVWATAYIKADSEAEAQAIADTMKDWTLQLSDDLTYAGDVMIFGGDFDGPNMPDLSLSPVMTIAGPEEGMEVEEVEY